MLALDRPFTYSLEPEQEAGVGSLVRVRFHGKLVRGWVLGPTGEIPDRVLPVHDVVSPVRFFDDSLLRLFRWVSERYVAPLATVIGRSHPPRVASEESPELVAAVWPAGALPLPQLEGMPGMATAHAGRELLRGPLPPASAATDLPLPPPSAAPGSLPSEYRNGQQLTAAITSGSGDSFLLRPVPEQEQELVVDAVRLCLETGRTAAVLVPEARPVPATARALVDALGGRVAVHLGGDKRARYRTWLDIRSGRYACVVGTRPAAFAPLENLGLVWVARESHPGHREERSPYFHVRDVALARARLEGAVCVISALCPSAEAMVTDAVHVSPSARSWPPVEVVKPGPEGRAPRLVAALKEARRAFVYEPLPGYGVARVCRRCGEPATCAACGGTLRAQEGSVRCAVCEAPGRCAHCGSAEFGIARGGAERVEQWLAGLVDTPVRRGQVPTGKPGVWVGGPEAVKDAGPLGLDLVGILDADLAARRPGLASVENALALWMEAAGWARPSGRVIVQTRRPGDPAIQGLVAGNPERFYRAELDRRARAGFPAGCPVFRVTGDESVPAELAAVQPVSLLETTPSDLRVCLVAVRPERVADLGRTLRKLAESGVVSRVEAEPHL